jgi:hypothetical protein
MSVSGATVTFWGAANQPSTWTPWRAAGPGGAKDRPQRTRLRDDQTDRAAIDFASLSGTLELPQSQAIRRHTQEL